MRLRILGKIWEFREVESLGDCYGDIDPPGTPRKLIRIEAGLSDEKHLETVVHEMTHAAGWHIDESFVKQFAKDVTRGLLRLGYRRKRADE